MTILLAAATPGAKPTEAVFSEADDRQLYACLGQVEPVDLDMKECWRRYAEREDDRLNQNWRVLLSAAGGGGTPAGSALLAEQRAWLSFRDASCHHFGNGTLDRLQSQICFTQRVTTRADEIATMVSHYQAFKLDQSTRNKE